MAIAEALGGLTAADYWDVYFKQQDGLPLTEAEKATLADPTISGVASLVASWREEALARAEARRKAAGLQQQQKDVIAIKEAEKQASKIKTVDATTVQVRLGGTEDTMEAKRRAGFKIKSAAPAISVANREVIKL